MENLSDDKEREQKHSFRPIFNTHLLVGSQISGMGIDRLNCGFF